MALNYSLFDAEKSIGAMKLAGEACEALQNTRMRKLSAFIFLMKENIRLSGFNIRSQNEKIQYSNNRRYLTND